MKLNTIRDNKGAHKRARLLGRGIGSGLGKTSGRGGKGQTARSGVRIKGFQGGQMPLHRRLPKRGFTNIHRAHYVVVNLEQVQKAIDEGRLNPNNVIDAIALSRAGLFKHQRDGVRLLGRGTLAHKVHLQIAGASASARAAVEGAGGSLKIMHSEKEKSSDASKTID